MTIRNDRAPIGVNHASVGRGEAESLVSGDLAGSSDRRSDIGLRVRQRCAMNGTGGLRTRHHAAHVAIRVIRLTSHCARDAPASARAAGRDRDARACARDEAALRRDERADEIDFALAASDAPLDERLAWLGVAAAGDRARAALDRELAARDRVDAARERAVLEGALRGRRPLTR